MTKPETEWRNVLGYEGLYRVSNCGHVFSVRAGRCLALVHTDPQRIYLGVSLAKNGHSRTFRVHRLVLDAFVGVRPKGFSGSHLDGNGHNNRLSNLKWESSLDNNRRMAVHGTKVFGERMPAARLTEPAVIELRKLAKAGKSHAAISRIYGVSQETIRRTVAGIYWKHVGLA